MVASSERKTEYVDYLIKEISLNAASLKTNIKTIYIGGGTPSSLALDDLSRLLLAIESVVDFSQIEEYTIEINPEDINQQLITLLKSNHINRISIGIQTFQPKLQQVIGRKCDYTDILDKLNQLKEAGFHNISVDLMYGIMGENIKDLDEDLTLFLTLPITHLSTYSLILEEKTILFHQYQKGTFKLIDEDLESTMYFHIIEKLKKHAFKHYELSNFALNGYEAKHNLIYWSNEEYISIGAGSSGYYNHYRYQITQNLKQYYDGINRDEIIKTTNEYITETEAMWEKVILALRLINGLSLKKFENKYNQNLLDVYPNITTLINNGHLEVINDYIRIPEKYLYLSNFILNEIR